MQGGNDSINVERREISQMTQELYVYLKEEIGIVLKTMEMKKKRKKITHFKRLSRKEVEEVEEI